MPRLEPNRLWPPLAHRTAGLREFAVRHRRRLATGAVAVLAVALGYHVVFGQNGLTAFERKRLEAEALRQQTADLERENAELKSHVDRLRSDPSAIERQARAQLHYTRPGEVIYTLPPPPPQP